MGPIAVQPTSRHHGSAASHTRHAPPLFVPSIAGDNTYPTLACRRQAKALSIVHTEGRAAGHFAHVRNGSGEQRMAEQNTRIDDRDPAATGHKQARQHRQQVGLEPRIPARPVSTHLRSAAASWRPRHLAPTDCSLMGTLHLSVNSAKRGMACPEGRTVSQLVATIVRTLLTRPAGFNLV